MIYINCKGRSKLDKTAKIHTGEMAFPKQKRSWIITTENWLSQAANRLNLTNSYFFIITQVMNLQHIHWKFIQIGITSFLIYITSVKFTAKLPLVSLHSSTRTDHSTREFPWKNMSNWLRHYLHINSYLNKLVNMLGCIYKTETEFQVIKEKSIRGIILPIT